ncbi:MAG: hypothetical protein FWD06_08870 [Oscillospiraceae bacterium]|nr:hypothetical protein [Oscillospiraceae bacterium]
MKKLLALIVALALLGACAAPALMEETTTAQEMTTTEAMPITTTPHNELIELTLTMQNTRDDVSADFTFNFGENEHSHNIDGWIVRSTAPIYQVRLVGLSQNWGAVEEHFSYWPIEEFPTIPAFLPGQTLLLQNYLTVGLGTSMAFAFEDAAGNSRLFEFHLYLWGIAGEPVAPYYTLREVTHYTRVRWAG